MNIIVTGYPRSGCVWVARLLGSCLNSPVEGPPPFYRKALVAEGAGRTGSYTVIQGHFTFGSGKHFLQRNSLNPQLRTDEKIVLIVRDPRDVAVSIQHYWHYPDLKTAVRAMMIDFAPTDPMPVCAASWSRFYQAWLDYGKYDVLTSYEKLRIDTASEVKRILSSLSIEVSDEAIASAAEEQDLECKRTWMKKHGDEYHFGKEAQLEHMRRGLIGEWRRTFARSVARGVCVVWQPLLERFGYESGDDWWRSLPKPIWRGS